MERDLMHSAKGTHWIKKEHKYINKIGGRYIYPSEYDRDRRSRISEDRVWDNIHTEDQEKLDNLVERHKRDMKKASEARGVEARKQFEDPRMHQIKNKQRYDNLIYRTKNASIYENSRNLREALNKISTKKNNDDKTAKKMAKTVKKYNAEYGKDSYKNASKSIYDNKRIVDLKPMKVTSKGRRAVESFFKRFKK